MDSIKITVKTWKIYDMLNTRIIWWFKKYWKTRHISKSTEKRDTIHMNYKTKNNFTKKMVKVWFKLKIL
jgi:hypothetical protein